MSWGPFDFVPSRKDYEYDIGADPDRVNLDLGQANETLSLILKFVDFRDVSREWLQRQRTSDEYIEFTRRIKGMMVSICTQTFNECAPKSVKIPFNFSDFELDFNVRHAPDSFNRKTLEYEQNRYCDIILESKSAINWNGKNIAKEHIFTLSLKYLIVPYKTGKYKVLDKRFWYEGIYELDAQLCDQHKISKITAPLLEFGKELGTALQNPYCLD
jgi:hypothetical protein